MTESVLIPQESAFELMVREKISGNHFTNFIGFEINLIKPGYIEGFLPVQQHHLQQMNFLHGGVTATLCDIVAGFAAFTLVKKGQGVVTVEMKISYFNPGIGNKIIAEGKVVKAGSKLSFCESELWALNGNEQTVIAKATATMMVINPEDIKQ
jgi:uncharacterized protein (TIGR00369 family)